MTRHLSDEEMVLLYYGEREDSSAHLAICEDCRRQFQQLQRTLNAVDSLPVPERPEDYGSLVWKRMGHRLAGKPASTFWWTASRWAMAATLLIGAFLLGRLMPLPLSKAMSGNPERVLLVAVGDHLDRSQMVLAEIANSGDPGKGKLDISYERKMAADLVESNRLYRVSADSNGDRATAALLDDLERVLLEIAHSPENVSSAQIGELRHEIEAKGLLFKVRVFQTRIQEGDRTI